MTSFIGGTGITPSPFSLDGTQILGHLAQLVNPVRLASSNAIQSEGNSGTKAITVNVTRSGRIGDAYSLNWAMTGSGSNPVNGADFGGTLPSGSLTFGANETSKVKPLLLRRVKPLGR